MIDKEDILKKLTSEDIIGIVEKYGGEKCSEDDEKIIFTTICHNSNSHKLYYYKNSGNFQCYTACGMIGNVFNFLIHINMYKFEDAIREVCDYKGIDAYSKKHRSFRNRKCNNEDLGFLKIHNYKVENKEYLLPIYDEQVLNCFEYDKIEKSWEEEGITDEVMDYFEIGFYSPDVCHTIPHRSYKDGSLCGIRRRTFLKELLDKKMKYMPIEINNIVYKYPMHYNIYGLWQNKEFIERSHKIVLWESEKSVLKLASIVGIDKNNSGALCSMNFNEVQRDIIKKLDIDEVIIALDKQYRLDLLDKYDEGDRTEEVIKAVREYNAYIMNLRKIFRLLNNYVNVSFILCFDDRLDYKDAPIDKGYDTYLDLCSERFCPTEIEEFDEFLIEMRD